MADSQIRGLGTGSAPLSYTVPAAQEIILKSLFASFDGTGAGGAFLPCVRIVAPGGGVVGEYITDASVAAGSSAEVSFAPFLRGATSSTPSSGTSLPSAFISQFMAGVAGSPARIVGTDYSGSLQANTSDFTLQDGNTSLGLGLSGLYQITSNVSLFDTQVQRIYNRECEVQVLDNAAVWGPFVSGDFIDYGSMPPGYIAGQASLTAVQSQIEAPYSQIANPQIVNVDPAAWNGLPVHIRPAANFAGTVTNPISLVIQMHVVRLGDLLV